ncbi:hypothetical protein D3C80_1887470 [compost metagenome]
MFGYQKLRNIRCVQAQTVIGGDRQYERTAIAHLRFGCHQDRAVSHGVSQFARCISCARSYGQHIEQLGWTQRFRFNNCRNDIIPRYIFQLF